MLLLRVCFYCIEIFVHDICDRITDIELHLSFCIDMCCVFVVFSWLKYSMMDYPSSGRSESAPAFSRLRRSVSGHLTPWLSASQSPASPVKCQIGHLSPRSMVPRPASSLPPTDVGRIQSGVRLVPVAKKLPASKNISAVLHAWYENRIGNSHWWCVLCTMGGQCRRGTWPTMIDGEVLSIILCLTWGRWPCGHLTGGKRQAGTHDLLWP